MAIQLRTQPRIRRARPSTRETSLVKDLAAGVAAGLVASWAMSRFETSMTRALKGEKAVRAQDPENMAEKDLSELPTVKTAAKLARTLTGRRLTRRQKKAAQPLVHYGFGAAVGAIFGVLSGLVPGLGGVTYGTGVWLLGDETALPALGLSGKPAEYPVSVHIQALAAHWVYGLVLGGVTRAVRRLLG